MPVASIKWWWWWWWWLVSNCQLRSFLFHIRLWTILTCNQYYCAHLTHKLFDTRFCVGLYPSTALLSGDIKVTRILQMRPMFISPKMSHNPHWRSPGRISCDISEAVRDRMSVTVLLITNRKSHTGFRLTLTSMTLNDLERHNSPYFPFFDEFDSFSGRLCHSGWI